LVDGKIRGRNETLTETDQRMINQRGLSQIKIEVMPSKMIEMNKDALDVIKRDTSKEIVW